jgi:hypothetical protein
MADNISRPSVHDANRVRILGRVAGVEACEVVTGSDEIRIGAGTDNDLVMCDPLVPSRAFTLVRHKHHCDSTHEACTNVWIMEAHPDARVFLNHRHTQRDKVIFGDIITAGCHQFIFAPSDPEARDRRTHVNVADLCAGLIRDYIIPPGYLNTCPGYMHRDRLRKAFSSMGALIAVLALLVLLVPREEVFEPVQPPVEVTMLAEQASVPAADAVRSLDTVNRQTFTPTEPTTTTPDLLKPEIKPVESVTAEPVLSRETQPGLAPPRLAREPLPLEKLAVLPELAPNRVVEVQREKVALSGGAPMRRLSVAEAEAVRQSTDLGRFQVKADDSSLSRATFQVSASGTATTGLQEPVRGGSLPGDRSQRLALMAALKPSPVNFEAYKGTFIPVAHIAEQLAQMKSGEGSDTLKIDGMVTTDETAKSWKSGAFRMHAPGSPPPEAKPPTYCYVSKTDVQGRQCLYISFVCSDPDVSQLIARADAAEASHLIQDDSVEIFLDTNFDRQDYCQLIVNSKGHYWTGYYKTAESRSRAEPWDAALTIKTSVNKDSGQWSCEILIPFDRLGGPPKDGTRWAVNFCRNFRGQKEDWQLQSWFAVYDKSREFHHPSKFGVFQW